MPDFQFDEVYRNDECNKSKDECLIVFKVYDQCRQQDCLTPDVLGPARFDGVTGCTIGGTPQVNGAPINPPENAAGVTIVPDTMKVSQILIVGKSLNQFKTGYYDVDLKISFSYSIRLFNADGAAIPLVCAAGQTFEIPASNIYNKKITLFGSAGTDVTVATDLFTQPSSANGLIQTAPFVFAEGKAIPLEAKLRYVTPVVIPGVPTVDAPPTPNAIDVTIGLFVIIKLYRTVQLIVESKGFCKPEPCTGDDPDPCEFFNSLDFPFNAFDPPQKDEMGSVT